MTKLKTHKIFLYTLILLLSACVQAKKEIVFDTETQIGFPFLRGSYKLGDLFEDYKNQTSINIDPGVFHSVTDTIPFNKPKISKLFNNIELIFRTTNVMPFEVNLILSPFDSTNNTSIGEPLFLKVVEAAPANFDQLSLTAVTSEDTLFINAEINEQLKQANSLILDLEFIWPYEKITTEMFDNYSEMFAFSVTVITIINL
ncbi:MAG: hypothetical protein JW735_12665 [Prolixibacteraceae bacterium]|nr:hypothetical protein [Prolixibacteraceae bacterium]